MPDTPDTDHVISSESVQRRIGPVAVVFMVALIGGLALVVWASARGPSGAVDVVEPGSRSESAGGVGAAANADGAEADGADVSVEPSSPTPAAADSNQLLVPPDRCQALVGRTPRITVRTPNPWISCVVVADFQRLTVWNNGPEPMQVDWPGEELDIAVNQLVSTAPVGESFPVGPSKVDSSPYLIPTIWRLSPDASPTADLVAAGDRFGPVVVGMTVERAAAELGQELKAGPTDGWPAECVFLADDPYSPIFVLETPLSDSSTISGIIDLKPVGADVGSIDGCETGG